MRQHLASAKENHVIHFSPSSFTPDNAGTDTDLGLTAGGTSEPEQATSAGWGSLLLRLNASVDFGLACATMTRTGPGGVATPKAPDVTKTGCG
jgi:hypothetical protein